jgi:hypothetical protein
MVQYQDGILTIAEIEELMEYLNAPDDHRTDRRPDFLTKHPRWDIDPFPQHILKRALDRVIGPHYRVQEIDFYESQTALKLHADAHAEPHELYYAVLMPFFSDPVGYTVFFDNYWRGHGRAAQFTQQPWSPWRQRMKDRNGEWVTVDDIRELLDACRTSPDLVQEFNVTDSFIDELSQIVHKRSAEWLPPDQRDETCLAFVEPRLSDYSQHIINYDHARPFPRDVWEKYLTHQSYEDFHGMILDQVVENVPGRAIYWQRSQLHTASSNHKIKNGVTVMTVRDL